MEVRKQKHQPSIHAVLPIHSIEEADFFQFAVLGPESTRTLLTSIFLIRIVPPPIFVDVLSNTRPESVYL